MYDQSSVFIALILFLSMALAIEFGYRVGVKSESVENEASKSQINAIQASLLGILALLLGFTFSLSLQRFDSRSAAVVNEANAIGTTYLRSQLLPPSMRGEAQELLRKYLDVRIESSKIALDQRSNWQDLNADANRQLDALWSFAVEAARVDNSPVTSGLFIQSLNELIDAYGLRIAVLNRHVPEIVLFLLYGTFLMSGVIVGYASGVSRHRAPFVTYIMVGLIVLLVFIIIDLDRPRRGLIEVAQTSLTDLQTSMRKANIADADNADLAEADAVTLTTQ